jgi:PAS domain S-box-containing protein
MQTLEDMRLWIEAIINSSDDAIISKDLNNNIVSWNKGAEHLYGYTEQEVIGKPISIIIPEDKLNDIPMTAELTEARKLLHHMETVRIAKDGKRIDVLITVSPILNAEGTLIGSSAIARDISERKRSEAIIHRSEERYRKIVELSPDTILIHQDGKVVFINQAGLKLFAADGADQLLNKSIWTLFTPDRHGIIRAHNQSMKVSEQAVANIEHAVIRLDGKTISVETSSCPITYEDKPAIYMILRDINERKKIKTFL